MSAADSPALVSETTFDDARLRLLRRRLRVFAFAVGLIVLLLTAQAARGAIVVQSRSLTPVETVALTLNAALGLYFIGAPWIMRRRFERMSLTSIARRTGLIVASVIVAQFFAATIVAQSLTLQMTAWFGRSPPFGPFVPMIVWFFVLHFTAALIIPWRPREAAVPLMIVVALIAIANGFASDPFPFKLLSVALVAAAGVPGLLVSWFRHDRLRETTALRVISDRLLDVQRELAIARRVHERMFPPEIDTPIRVRYCYAPAAQIGGDFVQLVPAADGTILLAVVDVTGHGIAAALAVNRLCGEMRRVLGEAPRSTPVDLARALNRYVHLTLSGESVYATALLVRFDPSRGELSWCGAGHPPALLRRADASIERLGTTAILLGAVGADEFIAEQSEIRFGPGDLLVAYTDGRIECRDEQGRFLGIDGLGSLVAELGGSPEGAAAAINAAIASFRRGDLEDDTLVVVVAPPGGARVRG